MSYFVETIRVGAFHPDPVRYGPISDSDAAERFAETLRTPGVRASVIEMTEVPFEQFFAIRNANGEFYKSDTDEWFENDYTIYNLFGRTHYKLPEGGEWVPAPRFNHMFTIAFTVISHREDGRDVTPRMFRAALMNRMHDLDQAGEWEEAIGAPDDTFLEDEE